MATRTESALSSVSDAAAAAVKDLGREGKAALAAVQKYLKDLAPEVEATTEALAQAYTEGGDTQTWLNTLQAQLDAVSLLTLRKADAVSFQFEKKIKSMAFAALQAVAKVALA